MSRRIWMDAALASVTAATLVAGCGTEPTDPGSIVVPTATTPSGAAELSLADAAGRYLEIVRPYNEALEDLEQAVNGGQDLATLTELAGDTAAALETELSQLESVAWPAEVQPHVDDLVAVSEQARPYWQEAAEAQSRDELVTAVLAAGEHDGAEAAGTIRELLELDQYEEENY